MSKTRKGSKAPGHEYWSARPGNERGGGIPGAYTKKATHRAERREGKVIATKHRDDA